MSGRHGKESQSGGPKSALASAVTPRSVKLAARLLVLTFLATPFLLAFVPWQQTVMCRGMVTAYAPTERVQVLTARVSGQVRHWHVVEGSRVKKDDRIVDIEDNDPELAARLDAQRAFLAERLVAARDEVAELNAAAKAQESARSAAVKAAEANREAARRSVEVARRVRYQRPRRSTVVYCAMNCRPSWIRFGNAA